MPRQVYECKFCGSTFDDTYGRGECHARSHEEECKKNPEAKACLTCSIWDQYHWECKKNIPDPGDMYKWDCEQWVERDDEEYKTLKELRESRY